MEEETKSLKAYLFESGKIKKHVDFSEIGLEEWEDGISLSCFMESQNFEHVAYIENQLEAWINRKTKIIFCLIYFSFEQYDYYATKNSFDYVSLLNVFNINIHEEFFTNKIVDVHELNEIFVKNQKFIKALVPLHTGEYFITYK